MNSNEHRYTGNSLAEIFEELEDISYAFERALSMLTVLHEAEFHGIEGKPVCDTLTVLYDHLYSPTLNLKGLSQIGRQLVIGDWLNKENRNPATPT